MRRYRNKKTGAVIEVYGQVSGKKWEPLDEAPVLLPEQLVDPYEEIFPAEPDDFPAPKPKTSRKRSKQ